MFLLQFPLQPLNPVLLPTSVSPRSTLFPSSSAKGRPPRDNLQGYQVIIRLGTFPNIKAEQSYIVGGEGPQKQAKELKMCLLPLLEVFKSINLYSHKIGREPSSYPNRLSALWAFTESFLVDSVDHFLWYSWSLCLLCSFLPLYHRISWALSKVWL